MEQKRFHPQRLIQPCNTTFYTAQTKAAVVGFSYNSPTKDWAKGHFDFVKMRVERHYHDKELTEYGNNSGNVRLFFALTVGYLLGLYQEDQISDEEFKIAEQQIPGLIMMHLGELTARPL